MVPMDPPALEPNNLIVADSDSYPSVTSLFTGLVTPRGEGCADDGKSFKLGIGHQQDSE